MTSANYGSGLDGTIYINLPRLALVRVISKDQDWTRWSLTILVSNKGLPYGGVGCHFFLDIQSDGDRPWFEWKKFGNTYWWFHFHPHINTTGA
jgi:hypothetical protein